MYGFIFGFHRLARCPKWTPAAIRSLTASTTKRHPSPRENSGPRPRDAAPRATVLRGGESVKNEPPSYRRDASPSNPGHSEGPPTSLGLPVADGPHPAGRARGRRPESGWELA